MSDAKKLDLILREKNVCIKKMAREAGLPPTTVYSILHRDGDIRFDIALRIARVLEIDVADICSDDITDYIKVEIIRWKVFLYWIIMIVNN